MDATETDEVNLDLKVNKAEREITLKRKFQPELSRTDTTVLNDKQFLAEPDAIEHLYREVFTRFQWGDDDDTCSRIQPDHYGDGVDSNTFEVLKGLMYDLVWATGRANAHHAELYLAAIFGVCDEEQRKKLTEVETKRFTPLTLACRLNNLRLIRFLVEHCKADVNGKSGIGRPLFWAIVNGNVDMVSYLLEQGADLGISVGDNFNFLMLAMQVFPVKSKGTLGYKEHEVEETEEAKKKRKKKESDNISVSLPREPKVEIVDLLMEYGAVDKCSNEELFDCLTTCMEERTDIHDECLPKLLNKIPNLINLRNAQGCSILGHEIKSRHFFYSEFMKKLLESGADINDTRIVKFYSVFPSDIQTSAVEMNVDSVLKQCINGKEIIKENSLEGEIRTCRYVHTVVYLAGSMSVTLFSKFLKMQQIPFEHKFDALEISGASCSNQQYFGCAAQCWKTANEMRQKKCVRVTRKKVYHKKNSCHKGEDSLPWDIDNISEVVAQELPTPLIMPESITKFMNDSTTNINNLISEQYEESIRHGVVPDLNSHPVQCSFRQLINIKPDDLALNSASDITRFKILTKSAMIFERLMGYGCFETLVSFDALSREYEKQRLVKEFVTLITYSFPYFVKYLPPKERKEEYLKGFLMDLAGVLALDRLNVLMTFDHLMAILKCIFLDCMVTPRAQRKFLEFSMLLVAIKTIHKWEKTRDESIRFSKFLRKIVEADLRNMYGQTLLHYTVPTIENESIDCYIEVERSQAKEEFSGCLELIKLLLAFGADPNAADDHGMTSLHFSYYLMCDINYEERHDLAKEIVGVLMDAGAHPDCVDACGLTPISYSMFPNSPVSLSHVENRTLQCLAASVIVKNDIPYRDHVVSHLADFIELHRKKGVPSELNFPSHVFG